RRRLLPLISGREVHVHRLETGAALRALRLANPLQFVHNASDNLTSPNSDSVWRHAAWLYRLIERLHAPSARGLLVFNGAEARRLARLNPRTVRCFTWYDPTSFQLTQAGPMGSSLSIAWVGRLDAQKDPMLAVRTLAELAQQ